MLSVHVIIVSSEDTPDLRRTKNSVLLAGQSNISVCSQSEMDRVISESKSDLIHLVLPGWIILPSFYDAMLTTIEHKGSDFVTCFCGDIVIEPTAIVKGGMSGLPPQFLVKRWVYREMGVGDINSVDLIHKVLGEYRGAEVPHVLTVRA